MEVILILGSLHYWIGVSQENAIGIMYFFTSPDLSKSQADSLLNQLADNVACLFVFVEHPEVEPTNNRSERNARREDEIRKGARTSKTQAGAKRWSMRRDTSASGTLVRRIRQSQDFTASTSSVQRPERQRRRITALQRCQRNTSRPMTKTSEPHRNHGRC